MIMAFFWKNDSKEGCGDIDLVACSGDDADQVVAWQMKTHAAQLAFQYRTKLSFSSIGRVKK